MKNHISLDLPLRDNLDNWKKIKMLVAPPGIKYTKFNINSTKESDIEKGFKEVKVGPAPERTQSLNNHIQAQRKQYGLKHKITGTIYGAMVDTLINMATE